MFREWAFCEGIEDPFPLVYVMYFVGYVLILAVDRAAAKKFHDQMDGHGQTISRTSVSQEIEKSNPTDAVDVNSQRD